MIRNYKIFVILVIFFFSITTIFLFWGNKSFVKAQFTGDTYPPAGGSVPFGSPEPPDACGGSCSCGASDCDANCGCWCSRPCPGNPNSCQNSGDCTNSGGYNCTGGGGSSTCSGGGCSTDCGGGSGGGGGGGGGGCTLSQPTGLTLQTPANSSSIIANVNFSWLLSGWGEDCDDPANNNWFEVCLGTGTTYSSIPCPESGGGGCHIGSVADGTTTGTCAYPYSNLDPATTYHWYVKASNGLTSVVSSAINSFTTGATLTGNVYQDDDFTSCTNLPQNNAPANNNWTIACTGGNATGAVKPNPLTPLVANSYACTNASGTTTLNIVPAPVAYTISASPPPGWTVQGYCAGDGTPVSGGTLTLSSNQIVDVYLRSYTSTWWQAVGADVWANSGGITSSIPSTATNPYLLIDGANIKHGVVVAGTTIDLGAGTIASEDQWGAENIGTWGDKSFDYDFWTKKLSAKLQTWVPGTLNDGLWKTTGNITLGGQTVTGKVFLITDGSVIINNNITVNSGGSLVVVARGDIDIDPAVTNLQGYFISDATISTGHTNGGDSAQLIVQGGLVGITAVNLERNFQNETNNTTPAEQFVFRPDMLINLNQDLKVSAIKEWQEIAP